MKNSRSEFLNLSEGALGRLGRLFWCPFYHPGGCANLKAEEKIKQFTPQYPPRKEAFMTTKNLLHNRRHELPLRYSCG